MAMRIEHACTNMDAPNDSASAANQPISGIQPITADAMPTTKANTREIKKK